MAEPENTDANSGEKRSGPPPKYALVLKDAGDYMPDELIFAICTRFLGQSRERAAHTVGYLNRNGQVIVGEDTHDVASTRKQIIEQALEKTDYTLHIWLRPVDQD